ncbi:tetraspanin-like protein [Euroglyphus maynei]|uniref:Tetraspanin n=1 Tax=Euroglyphus maynei TaxID=6958 RepID=A0A1Y3BJU6_EURMA|nr:tetraspanin-like protein [Euroglyphus maynei]
MSSLSRTRYSSGGSNSGNSVVIVRPSLMATCSGALVKIALVLFNLVLLCIGVFLTYTGYSIFDSNDEAWDAVIQTNFKTGSIVLMCFGALIALIAAIGAFGACLESSGLLDVYGYIIFFLVIAEIVLFYYSFKYKDELTTNLETGIKKAIQRYPKDAKLAYGLQLIQKFFRCCGFEGPNDYDSSDLPASCCDQMSQVSVQNPTASCPRNQLRFDHGCKHSPFIEKTLGSVTYAAYALVLIQLIVILMACCLSRDLRAIN